MTHQIFNLPPQQPLSAAGRVLPGAKLYFYLTGTSTPTPVYTTSALSVAHSQPLIADAGGRFSTAYMDPSITYKITVTDANDVLLYTVDPANDQLLSQASIGIYLYPTEAGETGVLNNAYPRGHVYRYGTNTVPGTTDMTTAFQNAGLSSLNPYAPGDAVVITGSIPLRDNQRWYLDGTRISITGTTVEVFTAGVGIDDWAIAGDWSVTGDNGAAGATSGSAAAVRITDAMRWKVDGLTAKNIKGWGIYVRTGSGASSRAEHGQITKFQAYACYRGIETEAGTGAEYVQIDAPIISRCNIGARVAAGNTGIHGGSITDNTTNVYLVNGSNHAHGQFIGVSINHATTLLYVDTVRNGHTFVGCHFYDGIMHFKNSTGVLITSGIVDAGAYRFEESVGIAFINNAMPSGYANTVSNNYNSTNSYTIWRGNYDSGTNSSVDGGKPWNGAAGNINGVKVTNALASSQVFTAANVNATSVIKLDDSQNASSNNTTQTAYDGYDASTGVYTCRIGGDGKVKVAAQLVISNNAADAGKFQCFMTHSSLGDYYFDLVPLAPAAAATSWVALMDIELPIDVNQTLTFKITGSGVANNVTVTNSAGTKALVEGL